MIAGRQRNARNLLVAQAAMFFFEGDVAHFVETGELDGPGDTLPYRPDVMAGVAANWKW